jgi:hypothetical protein
MRRWVVAAIAAGLVALVVAAGIPLYVLPSADEAGAVDVVYVIGPPTDARMDVALDMVADGDAGALMVSLDPEEAEEWPEAARVCAGESSGEASSESSADLPADLPVLCAKPDPFTTRGEARELEAQMATHGWDSAAVITFTPHISRTRMILERCDTGDVAVVNSGESVDPWYWVYQYAYQTAGYAKAFILQGC